VTGHALFVLLQIEPPERVRLKAFHYQLDPARRAAAARACSASARYRAPWQLDGRLALASQQPIHRLDIAAAGSQQHSYVGARYLRVQDGGKSFDPEARDLEPLNHNVESHLTSASSAGKIPVITIRL